MNDTIRWLPFFATLLLIGGCSSTPESSDTLTLATTTSTRDSGLLAQLVPIFESETGITVKVIAVGSGQALELGQRGDADVLLTHAPAAEEQFMADGFGAIRRAVMHNDFVIVGPKNDPAQIKEVHSLLEVFRKLADRQSRFVSRDDHSGTHLKERSIWDQIQINPQGDWYIAAGTGMAAALRIASEKRCYTIADRSTFLAQRTALDLEVLFEGDSELHNPYSVIVVNSKQNAAINDQAASQFSNFLFSEKARKVISEFGIQKYGQPLFFLIDPVATHN